MYWTGGYQDKDHAISATTTKLKGIALTNCTHLNITIHGGVNGNRIWDVADYVMPPQVSKPSPPDPHLLHSALTMSVCLSVCPRSLDHYHVNDLDDLMVCLLLTL